VPQFDNIDTLIAFLYAMVGLVLVFPFGPAAIRIQTQQEDDLVPMRTSIQEPRRLSSLAHIEELHMTLIVIILILLILGSGYGGYRVGPGWGYYGGGGLSLILVIVLILLLLRVI
jgi:hypothetical protein